MLSFIHSVLVGALRPEVDRISKRSITRMKFRGCFDPFPIQRCELSIFRGFVAPLPYYSFHYSINRPIMKSDLYARMVLHPAVTKPALCPIESRENDTVCVQERILKTRNTKRLSGTTRRHIGSFVEELVRLVPQYVPYSQEMVLEAMPRQDKAETIVSNYLMSLADGIMKTFQKRETYTDPKPPRNISPVPCDVLLDLSMFIYPFYANLKKSNLGWFAPGLKPDQIATQVARVTQRPYFGADYSKFDGHQNEELRRVVLDILHRCMKFGDHKVLNEVWYKEIHMEAQTSFGIKYQAKGTMLSGSPVTTVGNTLLNALVYYMAYRFSGVKREEVLGRMSDECILYGDDSAGPRYIFKGFLKAVELLGLKAKDEDCSHGLTFLGRVYYKDGYPYSIAQPLRVLSKIHNVCASLSVSLPQAACNKAHGLLDLCKGEFWIEVIAKRILKDWGDLPEDLTILTSEERFKLEFRDNPGLPPSERQDAYNVACELLDVHPSVMDMILECYATAPEVPTCWIDNGSYGPTDELTYVFDPYMEYNVELVHAKESA